MAGGLGGSRKWLVEPRPENRRQLHHRHPLNAHGGERRSSNRGLTQFAITLDTKKLGLWDGGTFYALFEDNEGRHTSADHVGDRRNVSGNDHP